LKFHLGLEERLGSPILINERGVEPILIFLGP
jgi:hypothetical protein